MGLTLAEIERQIRKKHPLWGEDMIEDQLDFLRLLATPTRNDPVGYGPLAADRDPPRRATPPPRREVRATAPAPRRAAAPEAMGPGEACQPETAFHESGHAVVADRLGYAVRECGIRPGGVRGWCRHAPADGTDLVTIAAAGWASVLCFFGSSANADAEWGIGEENDDWSQVKEVQDELTQELGEVGASRAVGHAIQDAHRLVREPRNRALIEKIAEALEERGRLDAHDLADLMA
jgi:hypothetical protein